MSRLIEAYQTKWDQSHGTYISGRAYIDGADFVAAQMEREWGVDRLRLLVSQELREKFDRQRYLYSAAITGGTLEQVRREAQRMTTAYVTLDAAARAAAAKPLSPEVWEVALKDGSVAMIVQSNVEAHAVTDGRRTTVWTLEEIAYLLDLYTGATEAKRAFPGATVTATRKGVSDPLDAIVEATNFDEPFGELFNQGRD